MDVSLNDVAILTIYDKFNFSKNIQSLKLASHLEKPKSKSQK